jgi:hypothetical protein
MPPYVEYGARDTSPPPFQSKGGSLLGLALKGDPAKIDNLIKVMLNEPAGGKVVYTRMGGFVVLIVGTFPELRASRFPEGGYVSETQLSLWLPLKARSANGEERVCLTAPYIFVDNPISLECGREDFGYPKSLGQFRPERWNGVSMQLKAFGGNWGYVNHAAWTPLIEIGPAGAAPPAAVAGVGAAPGAPGVAVATTPEEVAAAITRRAVQEEGDASPADLLGWLNAVLEFVKELHAGKVKQVFLKQFRDACTPGVSCYQAVVEALAEVQNVSSSESLQNWQVTLSNINSHPIHEDLGLVSQSTRLAFEFHMDLTLNLGEIVAP